MIVKEPLVSVIIPTYKRPDFLDRAIDSVLNQTYKNIEVIVVDDNNPDTEGRRRTEGIMEKYSNNPLVHYVKHECNKNGSAARNTGFRVSHGVYVAFLDDDDQYLPKKIESQVEKMESLSSDWGCCYNQYFTQRGDEKPLPVKESREGGLELYKEALMHKGLCVNAGSNFMVRREAYQAINGYDESFKRNQDHEFMVRMLHKYKMAYVPEPGLIYSVGTTNVPINYEEVIRHYIDKFMPYVLNLEKDEQLEFHKCMNRYLIINHLKTGHILKIIKMVSNHEVDCLNTLKWITETASGFIQRRIKVKQ